MGTLLGRGMGPKVAGQREKWSSCNWSERAGEAAPQGGFEARERFVV